MIVEVSNCLRVDWLFRPCRGSSRLLILGVFDKRLNLIACSCGRCLLLIGGLGRNMLDRKAIHFELHCYTCSLNVSIQMLSFVAGCRSMGNSDWPLSCSDKGSVVWLQNRMQECIDRCHNSTISLQLHQ